MRVRAETGGLSVHGIAGTHVVLLGINARRGARELKGLLGFAIRKTNRQSGRPTWIPGFKTFRGAQPAPGTLVSSREHPIQGFLWGDYVADAGVDYLYEVFPVYGSPGRTRLGDSVSLEIATEEPGASSHSVHFNRGAAASQAYVRRFGSRSPDVVGKRAFDWLSRGLAEAMHGVIERAKGRGWGLRAALYECSYGPVLEALAAARERGVDVQIVYDAKAGSGKPGAKNARALRDAGLEDVATPRVGNPSYISHNKFIVLSHRGSAVEVWTGSTNVTTGGIFGHSNVGHLVHDAGVAQRYLEYWETLVKDPTAAELRRWNDESTPVPGVGDRAPTTVLFSPRSNLEALTHYADLMDRAGGAVFLTAAFGVNKLLQRVLARDKPYLRYLLLEREDKDDARNPDIDIYKRDRENLVAVGSALGQNVLERWVQRRFRQEELTGLNKHVKYIHTKYMLINPLGRSPIVITGSANFSDASTKNNDENMLIIRDDPRVADIYLGEFMRLYSHYRFRWFANRSRHGGRGYALPRRLYLRNDASWLAPYYDSKSIKQKERLLFG